MYNVLDVARYIINYSDSKNFSVSNAKLQSLLYFVQSAFIVLKNKKCFNEDMEAWKAGAVIPEVYHEFNRFGSASIPKVKTYYVRNSNNIFDVTKFTFDEKCIERRDKELINSMVDNFVEYPTHKLFAIIKDQDPYQKACETNMIIKENDIKEYFGEKNND